MPLAYQGATTSSLHGIMLLGVLLIALMSCTNAQASSTRNNIVVDLTEAERQWLEAHPVIRVGPYANYPPAEYVDEQGQHQGIASDYVKLIEQALGIRFEYQLTNTWQQLLDGAKSRRIDVLAMIAKTPGRDYLDFSTPYVELPAVLLTRDNISEPLSVDKLYGLRVAVVRGYAVQEFLETQYPNLQLNTVAGSEEGVRALSTGQFDVFISDLSAASYFIQKNGINNLRIAGESGFTYRMGFAVRSDWPELRGIIDKVLAQIPTEQRTAIYEQWIHLENTEGLSFKQLARYGGLALAVVLTIFLAVMLWNRSLQQRVKAKTKALQEARDTLATKVEERTAELSEKNAELEFQMQARERVAHSLQASETLFRTAFNKAGVGMAMVDLQGRFMSANPAICNLLGYTSAQMKKMGVQDITDPDYQDQDREGVMQLINGEREVYAVEKCYRHKDGQRVWGMVSVALVRDEKQQPLHMVSQLQDITTRKKAEDALEERSRDLERSNRELEQFARVASEDLQIPLRNLGHYTELLKLHSDSQLDTRGIELLGHIQTGIDNMRALTEALLDLSSIGKASNKIGPIPLQACLDHAMADLEQIIKARNVQLQSAELPRVAGDHMLLTQLLRNLLHNAIKFQPGDSPSIHITANVERGSCTIRIKDAGIGIADEEKEKVFRLFERGQNSAQFPGTGIGLAICRKIVYQMHGEIWIETHGQQPGTTIAFNLPTADGNGATL